MFRKSINYAELKLEEKLGNGGYGVVYKAIWRHNQVAVKQILTDKLSSDSAQEFETESQIMGQLSCPNIVQFYGFCIAPTYCIVMEYMPNGSLFNLLQSDKPLEWSLRFKIALDITKGLSFLHDEKILHRDVKSANVLLGENYQAKLTDFGLSKVKAETKSRSMATKNSKESVGTLAWMAPELFAGRKVIYTQKSDVYSLGVTFWELSARQIPFKDAADPNLIPVWVQKGEREEFSNDCPSTFRTMIEQCWTGVPDQRPDTDSIITSLQSAIEQLEKLSSRESKEEIKITSPISSPRYESNLHSQIPLESKSPPKPMLLSKRLEGLNLVPENPIPAQVIPLRQPPKVNAQELSTFLKLVAEGEQDKAEAMLQKNQDLALVPGDVTDLSERTFKDITGFQYAVWALDWHMWSMMQKYLPKEKAAEQIQSMKTGSWVSQHGASASWQTLLDAFQKYINLCNESKWSEAATQWNKQVGGAQRLLPTHVVNEYCRSDRPFDPCPDFNSTTPLPRTRNIDKGEWYTSTYNNGKLGESFAYVRYLETRAVARSGAEGEWMKAAMGYSSRADRKACHTLLNTRVQQRDQLFAELSVNLLSVLSSYPHQNPQSFVFPSPNFSPTQEREEVDRLRGF